MRIQQVRIEGGQNGGAGFKGVIQYRVVDHPDNVPLPKDAVQVTGDIPITDGWVDSQPTPDNATGNQNFQGGEH
jgi:hypothetical protein